jgi:carboxyl-terminal processing protease
VDTREGTEKKLNREQNKFSKIFGIGMLVVVVFTLGLVIGRSFQIDASVLNFGSSRDLNLGMFWRVLDITRREYIDSEEMEDDELVYGAIKGLVSSLDDPATVFLTPEETEEFNAASQGKYFEGIGAELGYDNGQIIVVSPLEGSPAKEAGIRPGDYILKVDDYEFTSNDTVYDAVAKIRGEAGTEVVLTVLHRNEEEPVEITITRREITVPSMSLEFVGSNEDIAHLKIGRFTESNYTEWVGKWNSKVGEILTSGSTKMILDLRGNPGGFFDAAIYAGDEFLDEGFVISKQRDGTGKVKNYDSTKNGKLLDIELVVLVNTGSASASEILAGALAQANRAVIIGENTFGKGTAQRIFDLADGSTLHLTILRWLLPDGSLIERDNSVIPDIEIELTNEDFVQGNDPQLDKAIEVLLNK